MPEIKVTDVEGNTIQYFEFRNKHYPVFPVNDDQVLSGLPNLHARGDDVMLLSYPKSGSTWLWEVINLLVSSKEPTDHQKRTRDESMIEAQPAESLEKLPSVRLLNTHVTPELYPTDLVKKKVKTIYILRNPKDTFVSYFHFAKKFKLNDYHGSWNGYFNLLMDGKNSYGCWFEYAHSWDKFFQKHPDIPVLTLSYEAMKKDFSGVLQRLMGFLEVPCDKALLENIAEKSMFDNMKKEYAKIYAQFAHMVVGDTDPFFRKGIIGDWKNHFTVAQNERFDAEYKKRMAQLSFDFEQYM